MARLTKRNQLLGFEKRGRVGRPASWGFAHCGFNLLGADDEFAGQYQKQQFAAGRFISKKPFCWPTNPRTPAQQAWRAVFADGMSAYRALTDVQKARYTQLGNARGMLGYNFFLKKYLAAHRL